MTNSPTPPFDSLLIHASFVQRLARSLLRDEHAADDLAQDVLVAAWKHERAATKGNVTYGLLATIARRLATNRARGERRRIARESTSTNEIAATSPEQILDRETLRRHVVEAVLELEEPYRSTVIARYLDELPAEVIARRNGIPLETVRTRLKRATASLRERLERDLGKDWRVGILGIVGVGPGTAIVTTAVGISGWIVTAGFVLIGASAWFAMPHDELDPTIEEVAHEIQRRSEPVGPAGNLTEEGSADSATERVVVDLPTRIFIRRLRGQCFSQAGSPIVGVSVALTDTLHRDDGMEVRLAETTTDATGCFEFEATEATGRLRFEARGFATHRIDIAEWFENKGVVDSDAMDLGNILLPQGASVSGNIVDPLGRPVADARVVVARERDPYIFTWWRGHLAERSLFDATLSAIDGSFTLNGVPHDWVRVYATGAEGVTFRSEPIAVSDRGNDLVRVVIERLSESSRVVALAQNELGEPISSARLVHRFSREFDGPMILSNAVPVVTGLDGRYEFFRLDSEWHAIELRDDEGVLARVDGIAPGERVVCLRARPRALVTVLAHDLARQRVRLEERFVEVLGREAPGIDLFRTPISIESGDIDGGVAFRIPAVPVKISIRKPGFVPVEIGPIEPDEVPEEIEVELTPAPGIRGVVRDPQGNPIVGARVETWRTDVSAVRDGFAVTSERSTWIWQDAGRTNDPVFGSTVTGADGSFTLHPGESGSSFLRIEHSAFAPSWLGPFDLTTASDLEGLEIEMNEGGVVEGSVKRIDGASPRGLFVVASRGGDELIVSPVGEDGAYRIEKLAAGKYQVAVRSRAPQDDSQHVEDPPPFAPNCDVVPSRSTRFDLRWSPPPRVEGQFRVGGKLVPGYTARLVPRVPAIDVDAPIGRLRSVIWEAAPRLSTRPVDLDPKGAFDLEGIAGECMLVIEPRDPPGFSALYVFPVLLGQSVVRRDVDVQVAVVEGTASPKTIEDGRGAAHLLWRGPNGEFAVLTDDEIVDGKFRFENVPAGSVTVQVGETRVDVTVRVGETTLVDEL